MEDISNAELQSIIISLKKDLEENTAINKELLNLLKINNSQTSAVYDYINVELSPQQQWKTFGLNVAANLIGNAVAVPTIIDTRQIVNK